MSLDGFIAGPGGDMSWLTEHLGPNPTVEEFVLTHHAPDNPVPGVTFVGDLDSGVAAARVAAGDTGLLVSDRNEDGTAGTPGALCWGRHLRWTDQRLKYAKCFDTAAHP